jgi:hypothetical protein
MRSRNSKPGVAVTHLLLPRFIRLRDAPFYLGMDRNRFNAEVRKDLTTIPIGRQGIAFDRLELDAPSTDLNWTPGWRTIFPATGVPPKGARYGTQKITGAL